MKNNVFSILPYWTVKRLDAASDVGSEMWLFLAQLHFWVEAKKYPVWRGILLLAGAVSSVYIWAMLPAWTLEKPCYNAVGHTIVAQRSMDKACLVFFGRNPTKLVCMCRQIFSAMPRYGVGNALLIRFEQSPARCGQRPANSFWATPR